MPALFWDPFQHNRNFRSKFWKVPHTFDVISPIQRYAGYRVLPINFRKTHANTEKDVSLNVESFAPSAISVRVVDNTILEEAKHEERA